MSETTRSYMSLRSIIEENEWPHELLSLGSSAGGTNFLDYLAYVDADYSDMVNGLGVHVRTRVMADLEMPIPFLEGCSIVAGYSQAENSGIIDVDFFLGNDYRPWIYSFDPDEGPPAEAPAGIDDFDGPPIVQIIIRADIFSIRIGRSLLKPIDFTREGDTVTGYAVREDTVDIGLGDVILMARFENGDWSLDFEWAGEDENSGISIPLCMIADTGVIIEAQNVAFNLSGSGNKPAGAPDGWKGLYTDSATVYIPSVMSSSIEAQEIGIGTGGLYGQISAPVDFSSTGKVLGGDMEGSITSISLQFVQSIPVEATLKGNILLPFFDERVNVEIGINLDGSFAVKLAGVDNDGLLILTKRNLLTLSVESLGFEKKPNQPFSAVKLSGSLTPLVGSPELSWPTAKINEMTIYTDGRVDLDGGWLNLPEQFHLDFHGFSAELTQMGFGETDDGDRWIGFSGSIQLVAGLGLGAQFDGLRILWPKAGPINANTIRLSLEGVGVNLTIPDVLAFKGKVRFIDENGQKGFKGGVKLTLYSINLEIDAEILVVKTHDPVTGNEFTAFYIYINTDFPAGIPLASTGIAIYGLAGLYGQNVAPDKGGQEMWYENWYKGERLVADGGTSRGVAGSDKWAPLFNSMAFGAGVTLGTISDNGFAVNGKLLFVLILPGPIILLEGRANLLTERSKLSGASEPTFEALAVLDGQAGQFLLNVAAQYKKDAAGKIIDIRAGAEAFFDYHRADAWHLYLGQDEPREKRIRAEVLSLFHADSYFMLSARDLRLGFWVGFDESWDFGPLHAGLSAWIAADVAVSWKPVHVHGQLQLHGGFELSAFGFGLSAEVDARIAADAPTKFHLEAELSARLKLPWPLPDLKADIALEWGPEGNLPPVPLALGAASCEHLKASEVWPLARWPRYDEGSIDGPGFWNTNISDDVDEAKIFDPDRSYDEQREGILGIPVVPLDVRPVLSFAKPVYDDIGFGHKREGMVEQVGETSFEYHLIGLKLHKKPVDGGNWQQVASRSTNSKTDVYACRLRGTWQLVNNGNDALPNAKLMLWSKTTNDWSRLQAGSMYGAWVRGHLPDAFCPPFSPMVTTCVHWDDVSAGTRYESSFTLGNLRFSLAKQPPPPISMPTDVFYRPKAAFHRLQVLRLAASNDRQTVDLSISGFPYGTTRVTLSSESPKPVTLLAYFRGQKVASGEGPAGDQVLTVEATAIDRVVLQTSVLPATQPDKNAYLYSVCYEAPLNPERQKAFIEWVTSVDETRQTWNSTDTLLEPDHYYRLTVATRVIHGAQDDFTEYVYFQTKQPPGIDRLPVGEDTAEVSSEPEHYPEKGPLKDLSPYVDYTVPPPEARAVYCTYDIGAYFNENYVDAMYRLAHKPLKVFLYDANGELVTSLLNHWGENPVLTLPHTEVQWLYSLDQATCLGGMDLNELPPDQHLNGYTAGLLLRPETLYEARLVADGLDEVDGDHSAQYPVYKWRFITSRFAHFRHHIGSFRDQVWDEYVLRGQPQSSLLTAEQLAQLEALVTAERSGIALGPDDPPRFQEIASLFGFGTSAQVNRPGRWLRPTPTVVDMTLLRDATRRFGLLLESPEPFDPDRVSIVTGYNKIVAPLLCPPGAAKLFNVRLTPAGNTVNLEYVDILLLHDQDLSNWRIEYTGITGPENVEFVAYYSFPAGPSFKEGTLIRVHSGSSANAPVENRAVTYQHRYTEAGVVSIHNVGVQMHLVDAAGNTAHSHLFLSRYINRTTVTVWNRDHTAAFLFFPEADIAVGSFPAGQYQLSCTFKRTLDGHPLLKQENETGDEQAELDVVIR